MTLTEFIDHARDAGLLLNWVDLARGDVVLVVCEGNHRWTGAIAVRVDGGEIDLQCIRQSPEGYPQRQAGWTYGSPPDLQFIALNTEPPYEVEA